MNITMFFSILLSGAMTLIAAERGYITGVITDASSQPVQGAIVHLEKANVSGITGDDGTFTIKYSPISVRKVSGAISSANVKLRNNQLTVTMRDQGLVKLDLFDVSGRFNGTLYDGMMKEGLNRINLSPRMALNTYIVHCQIGSDISNYKITAGSNKITASSLHFAAKVNSTGNVTTATATLENQSDLEIVEVSHNSFTSQKVLINPLIDTTVSVLLSKSSANWIVELEKLYADQNVFADGLQNGGYMVLGSTHSTAGDYDIGIINLDQYGSVLSKNTCGSRENDLAFEFGSHSDGSVRLFGSIWYRDNSSKNDLMTMHLAQNGDSIGSIVLKTDDNIVFGRGTVTSDGGSIITGYKIQFDSVTHSTHYSAVIARFDASDAVLWKKEYDYHQYNFAYDITALKNGGFLFMGTCEDSIDNDTKIWLLKLDDNGNVLKEKVFNNVKDALVTQIIETDDNKLFLLGSTQRNTMEKSYLARLSSDCTVEWDSVITDSTLKVNCMTQIDNGTIVLACSRLPDRTSTFQYEFEGIHLKNIRTDGTLIRELNVSDNHGHAESISTGKDSSFIIASAQGYVLNYQKFFVMNVTW